MAEPKPRKPRRKTLSRKIERHIFVEADGKCPWCTGKVTAGELEVHHIDGDRSNNELHNLILTCCNHHEQIGNQVIPLWEVIVKKQLLCNPTVAEKFNDKKPEAGRSGPTIHGDNFGVVAASVNIGTLKFSKIRKGRREVTPGLIEADPDMRTYANYLVKRYILWRKNGYRMDRRTFNPGSAHGILGEAFGSPDSVFLIPQKRFHDWVAQAQAKIKRTVFGQQNAAKGNSNFHSWQEHLAERHGGG